jgi:hypothetical protein
MNWLRRRGSQRRFYLAAAGWARQVEHALSGERYHALIALVEKFADGLIDLQEMSRAHREAEDDVIARCLALGNQGLSLSVTSRRLAADYAAARAALPNDGWIAAVNALGDAGRVGKRADMAPRQMSLLRDIFGNPFRLVTLDPRWLTSTVVDLAQAIYNERAFERMPILADALMDAGCDSDDIIHHCRGDGPHVRGCWVVDLLLGKE